MAQGIYASDDKGYMLVMIRDTC